MKKFEYMSYSSFLTTMGNIWGGEAIRADDKPRRRERPKGCVQKSLEEPLLEAEPEPAPKEHWKVKALRIIHYIAERSRSFNRGMLIQTEG